MSKNDSIKLDALPADFYDQDDSDQVCFLCGNPSYTKLYDIRHFEFPFTFQQCQCGIEKQTPMPNAKFFEWFFNSASFFDAKKTEKEEIWGYYDYFADEASRIATSKRRYKKLRNVFEKGKKPLKVMKIGPASGTFLHVCKQNGHDVLGCDVSSRFADYARTNYQVEIDNGRFETMPYEDGQFDVVMLLNVIENVPNQEAFLKAIYRTLKPGGYLISNFVDMKNNMIAKFQKDKYFLYRPPICYGYTYDVYDRLMTKYGFTIKEKHRDVRYMHLEKISTLLRWRWLLKLSRFLRLSRVNFPIYAYPSKIIVAQK